MSKYKTGEENSEELVLSYSKKMIEAMKEADIINDFKNPETGEICFEIRLKEGVILFEENRNGEYIPVLKK